MADPNPQTADHADVDAATSGGGASADASASRWMSLPRPGGEPSDQTTLAVEAPGEPAPADPTMPVAVDGEDDRIVLPTKREAKRVPRVNVVDSETPKGSYRFVDYAGGVGRRTKKPAEVVKVGESKDKSWQKQLPHTRPVPEKNISLGAIIELFSDLELSHWTKNHLPSKWLACLVIAGVAAAILAGHIWNYGVPGWFAHHVLGRQPATQDKAPIVRYERAGPLVATGMTSEAMREFVDEVELLIKSRAEAEAIFASYCTLQVAEEVLYMIRHEDGVDELVRQAGAPNLAPKGWEPSFVGDWVVRTTSSKPYAVLNGGLPNGDDYHAYFLIEHDQLVLDWKATTAYSTAGFEELGEGRGDASEIRGWIIPDVYFNSVYEEGTYLCYCLVSPLKDRVIWCYTKMGTPISDQLYQLIRGGRIARNIDGHRRITLKLGKGPEGALPNQWIVEGIIGDDWLCH